MTWQREARPRAWRQGAGRQEVATVGSGHQKHFSTEYEPVALEVFKHGRWCIVAKVTFLDHEPVLAIAHRGQQGVKTAISIPLNALEYAERSQCEFLYFRRDTTSEMWRISLEQLRKVGWMARSHGMTELFVQIHSMQSVPWRKWPYAERTVKLGENETTDVQQLGLFGVAG